ncbi:MAG: L,D-transpeptidase [Bacteroidales bacterium]|jgi:lipoprotein-anchoring transpeptidase ErfK/SrfK|nr:L,D-transpeptidase [Bacteroidales bacterium]
MKILTAIMAMAVMILGCGPESAAQKTDTDKAARKVHYTGTFQKSTSYIVISKKEFKLYVYAKVKGEKTLIAEYPVCVGKNPGNKQKKGDMRTPESPEGKPFKISKIQPSGYWKHDFGDGRGSILSYGKWFLRLNTYKWSGIGIHGSTNNEDSVPGRGSEGCIRLRDDDIIHLKENYAWVGMPVTILPD